MKIELWIKDFGCISDLDISYWELEHLPLIGDFIDYCNEDIDLEFSGEVIRRTFVFKTDKVRLDIAIDNETYDYLNNYINKFRTVKGWFKHD